MGWNCPRRLICFLALLSTASAAQAGPIPDFTKDGLPNIKSTADLVMDWSSGKILFERDADVIRPLASLSKLVAALVLTEECRLPPEDLHEMSVANREAAKGGDKSALTTGWKFSHRDLMHAALMRSDNRALPALGQACKLTPAELGDRMTTRVRRLGLTKTTFVEPNGLSPMNVTTAREMMQILKEVVKVPYLAAVMSTPDYEIAAIKGERVRRIKIRNTDRLLTKNLAEIIGGKTGYTDLARYCLAVAARLPDRRELGMVFLGAEGKHTRFADFTRVIRWLQAKLTKTDSDTKILVAPPTDEVPQPK